MFYTDDPNANWCFDSVAKNRRIPPTPAPTPEAVDGHTPVTVWSQLFTRVLDELLPYPDAYQAVRRLTAEVLGQLRGHPVIAT